MNRTFSRLRRWLVVAVGVVTTLMIMAAIPSAFAVDDRGDEGETELLEKESQTEPKLLEDEVSGDSGMTYSKPYVKGDDTTGTTEVGTTIPSSPTTTDPPVSETTTTSTTSTTTTTTTAAPPKKEAPPTTKTKTSPQPNRDSGGDQAPASGAGSKPCTDCDNKGAEPAKPATKTSPPAPSQKPVTPPAKAFPATVAPEGRAVADSPSPIIMAEMPQALAAEPLPADAGTATTTTTTEAPKAGGAAAPTKLEPDSPILTTLAGSSSVVTSLLAALALLLGATFFVMRRKNASGGDATSATSVFPTTPAPPTN